MKKLYKILVLYKIHFEMNFYTVDLDFWHSLGARFSRRLRNPLPPTIGLSYRIIMC